MKFHNNFKAVLNAFIQVKLTLYVIFARAHNMDNEINEEDSLQQFLFAPRIIPFKFRINKWMRLLFHRIRGQQPVEMIIERNPLNLAEKFVEASND